MTLSFEYQKEIHLSEIVSDIEYIRLETNDSCLIGSIKQLLKFNNRYYILDASVGKKIYMFDEHGNYMKQIDRVGRGPGEYAIPYAIAINQSENQLIVSDVMQGKMLAFDVETFDFIEESFPDIEAQYFCFLNKENDIAWYNTRNIIHKNKAYPYHIITTKSDGTFINEMINIGFDTGYILRPTSPFFQTDSSTLFSHPYQGWVYRIFADKAEALLKIDMQNHPFPTNDDLVRLANNNTFIQLIRKSDFINYFETFESDELYCFTFFATNTYFMALHSKVSKKSIYFPVHVVENNRIKNLIQDNIGILYFDTPVFCVDNSYYSLIQPAQIIENKENYSGNIHPQLQGIIDNIKIEDNPVILKYKLHFR